MVIGDRFNGSRRPLDAGSPSAPPKRRQYALDADVGDLWITCEVPVDVLGATRPWPVLRAVRRCSCQ